MRQHLLSVYQPDGDPRQPNFSRACVNAGAHLFG
jgi:hypothetical protein